MELFKYFKPDIGLQVLTTGLIRFSQASAFNDPFELKPNIVGFGLSDALPVKVAEVVTSEYERLPAYIKSSMPLEEYLTFAIERIPFVESGVKTGAQHLAPILRQALEERIEQIIGVFCLTDSPSNLPMWAHYADSHRGIVIGFDTSHEFFQRTNSSDGGPCHLKKVIYCDQRPSLMFSGLRAEDIFLTKGLDWRQESEWRMFAQLNSGEQVNISALGDAVHLFPYPREAVTRIIVGTSASRITLDSVKGLVLSVPTLSNSKIEKATIDKREYQLNFQEIQRFD